MNNTAQKLEKNLVKFDYTATAEEFANAVNVAYGKNKHKYNVPGFRKGHAPKKVIEGMYGAGVFFSDAVNELIDKSLIELEQSKEYDFVAVDSVNDVDVLEDGGVKYSITMVLVPEVKLGQYKGLSVEKTEVSITDKEVDEYIANEQNKQARLVDVDKAAKNGNTVLVDYVGTVGGVKFDGGSAEGYELELGSGTFIPGFEEQLVGIKAGEHRDVKVTFPTEDHAENLAGKEAIFACDVKAVREKELPALDDEFAKEVSEFDTLAEYKKDVKAKLTAHAEAHAERDYEDALVEKIVEGSEVEIPNVMIEQETEDMVRDMEYRVSSQGIDFEMYLKYMNATREKLAEEYKEQAGKRVKTRLVMEEIIKAEKIEIEEKDIDARLEKMAEESSQTVEEVRKSLGREQINYLANSILSEKLITLIKDVNSGVAPKKTAAKKATAKKAAGTDDTKAEEKKTTAKKTAKKADTKPADAE
ncbi:MAG: trigger factor [Clostridia bacterium]|nr:trigger factor [Clostridia bacterium]